MSESETRVAEIAQRMRTENPTVADVEFLLSERERLLQQPAISDELTKVAGMFPDFGWPERLSFSEAVAEQLVQMTRLKQPAASERRCVKCGHAEWFSANNNGICAHARTDDDPTICGCKCKVATTGPTEHEFTIEDAAKVVYRKYGANLAAFWRDAFAAEAQKHGRTEVEQYNVDGNCIHCIPICRECQLNTINAHLKEKDVIRANTTRDAGAGETQLAELDRRISVNVARMQASQKINQKDLIDITFDAPTTAPAAAGQDEPDIYDAVAEFRQRSIDQVIASDPALKDAFDIQQPKSYQPRTVTGEQQNSEDRSIKEIQSAYDSWRAFHCTSENAEVFERQNERMHRDIGTLLRALEITQPSTPADGAGASDTTEEDNELLRDENQRLRDELGTLYAKMLRGELVDAPDVSTPTVTFHKQDADLPCDQCSKAGTAWGSNAEGKILIRCGDHKPLPPTEATGVEAARIDAQERNE